MKPYEVIEMRAFGPSAKSVLGAVAVAALSACGGGGGSDSSSDPGASAPSTAPQSAALCPATLDDGTVYTIGAGSGELGQLQLDTTKMTWTVKILDSSVPRNPGGILPTRSDPAGGLNVMSGALVRETALPTERQNKCTFRLAGASLDPAREARVFVGFGVVGGTLPGARVQFAGHLGGGAVPDTLFPYYQFIGFSDIETDVSKVAGDYNGVGYHVVPTKRFQPVTQDFRMRVNGDGSFVVCDNAASTCDYKKGNPFVPQPNGALLSTSYKAEIQPPTIGGTKGHAYLIVGKLRGQLVPVLIRVGFSNDPASPAGGDAAADDEIGMGVMAPISAIASGGMDGQYIGVDSNFDYRATALVGSRQTLLDPFHPADASLAAAYTLDYAQTTRPGVVATQKAETPGATPASGKLIYSGGVLGFLDMSNPSKPYFTAGALVQ